MCLSVHGEKDFTVVSITVHASFSKSPWSKHQDFVKESARFGRFLQEEPPACRQDHEQGAGQDAVTWGGFEAKVQK